MYRRPSVQCCKFKQSEKKHFVRRSDRSEESLCVRNEKPRGILRPPRRAQNDGTSPFSATSTAGATKFTKMSGSSVVSLAFVQLSVLFPVLLMWLCRAGNGVRFPMKRKLASSLALIALLFTSSGPLVAHHGNSAYDERNPITLKGTVTDFVWANPHTQIYLDVTNEKGNVVHWGIESQSPAVLTRNGWTRHSLNPGDHIAITLIPAKNGAPVGFSGTTLGKVVLSDGRVLTMQQR